MNRRRVLIVCCAVATLVVLAGALRLYHNRRQAETAQADAAHILRDLQASHIEANVPAAENVERFLTRDLEQHFTRQRGAEAAVQFEWLRRGPTQSGVALPKYYLWVRINGGAVPDDRGAVRVAAIERQQFTVTDFLSEPSLRADPQSMFRVFPKPVCERITELLYAP